MRQLGKYVFAPPPVFGRPGVPRFRRMVDSLGAQYDADYFTYTAQMLDPIGDGSQPALPGVVGATCLAEINFDNDSAFELTHITGGYDPGGSTFAQVALPNVGITIFDQVSNRALMNTATPMANILGDAAWPFIVPIFRRFMPSTQCQVVFNDLDGAAYDNVFVTLHGRKLFTQGMPSSNIPRFNSWVDPVTRKVLTEDFFAYSFTGTVPAATSTTAPGALSVELLIEQESDFEWIETTASSLKTSDDEITLISADEMPMTFRVQNRSTGRYLSDRPIPAGLYAGGSSFANGTTLGLQPLILPQPHIWPAAGTIALDITNWDQDNSQQFWFTMLGRKIFEAN